MTYVPWVTELPPDQPEEEPVKDFQNWMRWTRKNRPEYDELDSLELWLIYEEYYSCRCESCERRKELGYMPVRGLNPDCTTPVQQLDLRRYFEEKRLVDTSVEFEA